MTHASMSLHGVVPRTLTRDYEGITKMTTNTNKMTHTYTEKLGSSDPISLMKKLFHLESQSVYYIQADYCKQLNKEVEFTIYSWIKETDLANSGRNSLRP